MVHQYLVDLYPSLRKTCPWYRNGWCHSPRLEFPSAKYTHPDRCLTILHVTCKLYVPPSSRNTGYHSISVIASPVKAYITG